MRRYAGSNLMSVCSSIELGNYLIKALVYLSSHTLLTRCRCVQKYSPYIYDSMGTQALKEL